MNNWTIYCMKTTWSSPRMFILEVDGVGIFCSEYYQEVVDFLNALT